MEASPIRSRGKRLYFAASMVAPASALLRNIVIARLLGPEMFGLAVTLVITGQFFDTVTNVGSDQFLVQDESGNAPRVQNMAQLTLALRGFLSAVLMVLVATPLADFYHQPQLAVPLMWMGLIPLSNGLLHLDIRRYQKQHNFAPESRAIIVSELVSLAIALAAAFYFHNYYAALLSLLARSAVFTAMSHIVAERRYGLQYEATSGRKLWRFGWPLALNGGLLFFGAQGDRILIGHLLGPRELGLYSTTLLLILYPGAVVQKFLTSTHFPAISGARDNKPLLIASENRLKGQIMLLGVLAAIGFVLVAPIVLYHVYGPRFVQAPMLVGLIGLLQVIRLLRSWPATIALAMGRTGLILASNVIRMSALPFAWLAYAHGYGLMGLTCGLMLGEALSLLCSLWPFAGSKGRQLWAVIATGMILVATLGEVVALALISTEGATPFGVGLAVSLAVALAILMSLETPLRATIRDMWSGVRGRRAHAL